MDPYRPPASTLAAQAVIPRHRSAYVLLALAGVHVLWLAMTALKWMTQLAMGTVALATAGFSLLGCALLYIGALRFARNSRHGSYWFFASAMWSGVALPGWGSALGWNHPFAAATGLALLGWWLVRRAGRQELS